MIKLLIINIVLTQNKHVHKNQEKSQWIHPIRRTRITVYCSLANVCSPWLSGTITRTVFAMVDVPIWSCFVGVIVESQLFRVYWFLACDFDPAWFYMYFMSGFFDSAVRNIHIKPRRNEHLGRLPQRFDVRDQAVCDCQLSRWSDAGIQRNRPI